MSKGNKTKGFTIIEVVLVLAIAGLIFMMVFVALPALQRSQRDTARKNDVSSVVAAVASYVSNNKGTFPDSTAIGTYVTGTDISGNSTSVVVTTPVAAGDVAVSTGVIQVIQKGRCVSNGANKVTITLAGTARQYIVITWLEAGNGVGYCQEG